MASCHSPSSSDHSRDELCHQPLAVAALDRIDTRLLTIGKLDPQQPGVLAQLHGAEEPIRRYCGVRCSIHLPVSPLRPITTWTKEIAGKLRRAFVPAHSIFPAHRWKIGKPGEDSDEDIVVRVKADAQVAPS